jgi:acyl-[acyl-carrier-protein]-phospholipid O-acyltransferase/long-chain-fatty-acid--[acyl-carrier-protein] ligase
MHKIAVLLKTKRFLPLFITQFLGAFNDNVYRNALAVLIMFHISSISDENKAFYSSIAIAVFMLPFFLFSATAGIIADKFNKAKLIRIIKFCEIIVMGVGVVAFLTSNIYLLFAVLFATGLQSTFFGPIKYSILPDHLQEDELLAGNSLVEAGTFIAIILGAVIGGLVISENSASLGLAGILVFGLAVISYVTTWFIPKTESRADAPNPSINFIKDTISVIKTAKQNARVFKVIIGLSWFWLIGAVLMSQMLDMTKSVLTSNQQVYTLILTLFCVGIGAGSIACNVILKGQISGKIVPICMFIISIFMFDFAYSLANFTQSTDGLYTVNQFLEFGASYRIIFDLVAISLLGGIYSVPLYAIMQHDSAAEDRSKIIAANNIVNALFMVVASLACTILINKLGVSLALVFTIFATLNLGVAYYAHKTI